MQPANPLSCQVRINPRLVATLTMDANGLSCTWTPGPPDYLGIEELDRYRRARNDLLAEFSQLSGCRVVVVE